MVVKTKDLGGNGSPPVEGIGTEVARHAGLLLIEVSITGATPLIMNALSEDTLLSIRDKGNKKPKASSPPAPRDEAESKLHRLPDGRPHVPAHALYKSFINAGQFVRLDGKRQVSTDKKTVLPGMLHLVDTILPLVRHDGITEASWEVDVQAGRNPNGGELVCLIRPRFDEWRLDFTLELDQNEMSLDSARKLVDTAGKRIGLHEFTPRHKGIFGCFLVTSWQVKRTEIR